MSEQKRGIGDNSKITEAKVFTDYVSPLEPKEVLRLIKDKLESAYKFINASSKEHTASHGDDYYFESEINEKESCDALNKIEFGVWRKPNTYEKKAFARDSEISSGKASKEIFDCLELIKKTEKGVN